MKSILLLLTSLLLASCATRTNIEPKFENKEICFLLYNVKTENYVDTIGEDRCRLQLPPASTFKVPLSLMAYDSGIMKNETTPEFKWNGEKHEIEPWNKDHNPTSWMRDSVVWVSQEITPQLGEVKIQKYLIDFAYGNQDISGGIKYFWLTPAPSTTELMQNSLKISGYEQVLFLTKLWRGELKASAHAHNMTQSLLTVDKSPVGSILQGKTGSGRQGENHDLRIGWYVGHLTNKKGDFVVVINFVDKQTQPSASYGGPEAKEMAKKILAEKGLW